MFDCDTFFNIFLFPSFAHIWMCLNLYVFKSSFVPNESKTHDIDCHP